MIARDLAAEFALTPADLGLLTSTYLIAFGLFQLPLGVLLDRFGPRRIVAGLLCVAALGAAVFAAAGGFGTLALGRALIGLGVSACLMGSIKAFTQWFPLSRLATLNGWFIFCGGIGGLAATAPVEAALGVMGWRTMFWVLAGGSLAAAAAIALIVPDKPIGGAGTSWRAQFGGLVQVLRARLFWRIVAPFCVTHGTYQALQGLWLGPWLADVAGLPREGVAQLLLVTATAYALGSVFFGVFADRLAARGLPRLTTYKCGVVLAFLAFLLIAFAVEVPRAALLAVYGFTVMAGALSLALLPPLFPAALSGRVVTAINFTMFAAATAVQWGVGAVLRAFPVAGTQYAPEGYGTALVAIAAVQLAAIAWLLPMPSRHAEPARGGA